MEWREGKKRRKREKE